MGLCATTVPGQFQKDVRGIARCFLLEAQCGFLKFFWVAADARPLGLIPLIPSIRISSKEGWMTFVDSPGQVVDNR